MSLTAAQKVDLIREKAMASRYDFARLVGPHRVYGDIHKEVFDWWDECDRIGHDNTLLLLPRDHQKSHLAAVSCAYILTKDPTATVLYVSATAALAEAQLRAVCDIMETDIYRQYWPTMINKEKGKREKWTNAEIIVDHPLRKKEAIRDPSVKAVGLTGTITGFHATHVFLDDMVEPNNAYTELGRNDVKSRYSQLASIETTGAKECAVGTRYHPKDMYSELIDMKESVFDENDEIVDQALVYKSKIKVVEKNGDFLWPRSARADGKAYGFNRRELERKRAKYLDKTQFHAQYYQEPNDPSSNLVDRSKFQYYDKSFIKKSMGSWYYNDKLLNVYASIDLAFTISKTADYTAIVVVGMDCDGYIYILDIDRFRTDRISGLFERLKSAHARWEFRKIQAEINAAQGMIVNDLKDEIRKEGMALSINGVPRNQHAGGQKEVRVNSILQPRYENQTIWHFQGGYTPELEEEVILARPPHDDIKDSLASAIEIAKPPSNQRSTKRKAKILYHSRFGGVAH